MRNPLLNWLFYGHIWIALAALGLSWQSSYLATGSVALRGPHYFVFLATLCVYTLHRYLSYRRAASDPDGRRYRLVGRHPHISLAVGIASLVGAGYAALHVGFGIFLVLAALPFTFFYLIPLYPGGPRLRDLPYLKTIWVALAWMVMTDLFPLGIPLSLTWETVIRFLFVLSIALLFDTRDVALDRRQGVRTLAADYPTLNRWLAVGMLGGCAVVTMAAYPSTQSYLLTGSYLTAAYVGYITKPERGEDFYTVVVDGLFLLPPAVLYLFMAINAAP